MQEKSDKIQHLYIMKTVNRIEIDGNFLNLISFPLILCPCFS